MRVKGRFMIVRKRGMERTRARGKSVGSVFVPFVSYLRYLYSLLFSIAGNDVTMNPGAQAPNSWAPPSPCFPPVVCVTFPLPSVSPLIRAHIASASLPPLSRAPIMTFSLSPLSDAILFLF